MHNKKHNIIDDAWDMKEEIMGGAEHTMRTGLVINTVINSIPVVIPDIRDLVIDEPKFDYDKVPDDPILLNFKGTDMYVSVLIVRDKDSRHVQCYPFTNINEWDYWWIYEMAFDLTPDGLIEVRPVHPLVNMMEPTKDMMNHLESLAIIVSSYLQRLEDGSINLIEESENFSKINKKRVKKKRHPIENDWVVNYACSH